MVELDFATWYSASVHSFYVELWHGRYTSVTLASICTWDLSTVDNNYIAWSATKCTFYCQQLTVTSGSGGSRGDEVDVSICKRSRPTDFFTCSECWCTKLTVSCAKVLCLSPPLKFPTKSLNLWIYLRTPQTMYGFASDTLHEQNEAELVAGINHYSRHRTGSVNVTRPRCHWSVTRTDPMTRFA